MLLNRWYHQLRKLDEDGKGDQPGMCSYNHYAYGAVGDFLYRRVAGIEATSGGYKTFNIKPVIGGGLKWVKAFHKTPYGKIEVSWKIEDDIFTLEFKVPVSTTCLITMPSGKKYHFEVENTFCLKNIGKGKTMKKMKIQIDRKGKTIPTDFHGNLVLEMTVLFKCFALMYANM